MHLGATNGCRAGQRLFSDMYPAALRVFRAFSAKRLFYHEPRARGLTLGFSLGSASDFAPSAPFSYVGQVAPMIVSSITCSTRSTLA